MYRRLRQEIVEEYEMELFLLKKKELFSLIIYRKNSRNKKASGVKFQD